jgi:squalene-hopene/tetraprenyl-beta-curcumene cyclase
MIHPKRPQAQAAEAQRVAAIGAAEYVAPRSQMTAGMLLRRAWSAAFIRSQCDIRELFVGLLVLTSVSCALAGQSTSPSTGSSFLPRNRDISFANEVEHAIDRGLAFLLASQNEAGWWSSADHPAVTSLALSAFLGHPQNRYRTNLPPALRKGLQYVVDSAVPDGRIYRTSMANYNTAISAMALTLAADPDYTPIVERARHYLTRSQVDLGERGALDSPFDGGVGYNDKYEHSDLNNTLVALEALYYTRPIGTEGPHKELNWKAAIHFIQSCQNLPSHNSQPWVADTPADRGGFVYLPGESKAGGTTNAITGRVALRSYGSISYAGLLSYIYADLDADDPRVAAALGWLRENYTLEENPAMGLQGYYYYLHLMSKALATLGLDKLELKDGTMIDWRRKLAMRLINLQQSDGSWVNTNGRWWENDPTLVTAYSVMTLEFIYPGL